MGSETIPIWEYPTKRGKRLAPDRSSNIMLEAFDEGEDIVHVPTKVGNTCNQLVVGSNPTRRAKITKQTPASRSLFCYFGSPTNLACKPLF